MRQAPQRCLTGSVSVRPREPGGWASCSSGHLPAQDPMLWDRGTRAIVRRGHSWDSILACGFPGSSLTTLLLPFSPGFVREIPLPHPLTAGYSHTVTQTCSMDVRWSCHKCRVSGQAHTD